MKTFILCLALLTGLSSFAADMSSAGQIYAGINQSVPPTGDHHHGGTYYDWGRGQNGYGYCYQFNNYGQVLNGGAPQPNYMCEQRNPSYFNWGRGYDGYGYCYQYTPYGLPMNEGIAQANYRCEQRAPSHYSWGRGQDGYVYCYQYTPQGVPMNMGAPVSNYYCH